MSGCHPGDKAGGFLCSGRADGTGAFMPCPEFGLGMGKISKSRSALDVRSEKLRAMVYGKARADGVRGRGERKGIQTIRKSSLGCTRSESGTNNFRPMLLIEKGVTISFKNGLKIEQIFIRDHEAGDHNP